MAENEETILFQIESGVARITLNRPDVLNSFDRTMAAALQSALAATAADDDIRAVLLTGAGRAFCAGQDLAEVVPPEDAGDLSEIVDRSYNPIIRALTGLEKPIVCAVNGVAAGAGANVAFACDLVLASRKAVFIQSFCHIGLIPDSGGTYFLPRLVGLAKAKQLALLGEKLSADEAASIGLIYKVCDPETLADESWALAARLATRPTRGLGLTKRLLHASLDSDLEQQLAMESTLQGEAGRTQDYREGVDAFLQKRKPVFKGK